MKRSILASLFLISLLFLPVLAKRVTNGFRLGKMALDLYSNPAWEVQEPSPETMSLVQKIAHGKLRYLSHGAQSFVFVSEDGNYIVKLFRYDQRVHPWRLWLRDEVLKKKKRLRHDEKIHRLFCACKLAYESAKDLTGLVYVHLNQTQDLFSKTVFVDSLGRNYKLDLNRYRFAIQHRAYPFRDVLEEAIESGDGDKVKRLIRSFNELLSERTKRGIRNSDTKVAPNFGFWGERAIEWDFGNYWLDPKMDSDELKKFEREQFAFQLRTYLEQNSPEYIPYYESCQ